MPKPKKMPRDAQLPPLKRMRLAPREPETPPPGHEETEIVLVEPDLPQGRGAEIPQPRTFPRRRPQEPSMPPPRGAAASSSGSGGRARRDWDDDRSQRHRNASSDEAAVLECHFDSIASIKGKRVQPPTRLWEVPRGCGKAGKVVHSGCRACRPRRAWLPTPGAISSCVGLQSRLPPEVGQLFQVLSRCRSPSPMPGHVISSGRRLGP